MNLHLFEGYGVELEYMIVDRQSLDVCPIADRLLERMAERPASDAAPGTIALSNELVLHLVELKTERPAASLVPLPEAFLGTVREVNRCLEEWNAKLMPTAMHPWMDPERDARLWPHEYNEVYRTFDRIFGCKGHGWSNLQSVHLNLPFADEEEFGRLHAAIRLVLPILPALAASSPVVESRVSGWLDSRMDYYRRNSIRIPSITAGVVPEPVFTPREYQTRILDRMYADIAELDPEEILRDEWLNARGAIARFQRNTIEIRVLDVQECPAADLAILEAAVAVVRGLVDERWCSRAEQMQWPAEPLQEIFLGVIREAEQATILRKAYAAAFGLRDQAGVTVRGLWEHLRQEIDADLSDRGREALDQILAQGCLARRILRRIDGNVSRNNLADVYDELGRCLEQGVMFEG